MKFVVIVVFYNMEQWLERAIDSIRGQSYGDFRCLLGDDISTDGSASVAARAIADDPRFELIRHQEKKFNLGNTAALIDMARPDDEDIIVLVDGDDYLAHPHVLQKLADIYKEYDCWMTYGSFRSTKNMERGPICRPYPPEILLKGGTRRVKWRVAHLRTFKYKLWKNIRPDAFTITQEEFNRARWRALWSGRIRAWLQWLKIRHTDLVDPSGRYVRRCADKAFTFPMLELAGPRVHFIDEILYVFNLYEKDLNFGVRRNRQKWYTRCIRDILKHKPLYQRLEEATAPALALNAPSPLLEAATELES
jgi:glycosyltransferase involved in cell wall biosynthesis